MALRWTFEAAACFHHKALIIRAPVYSENPAQGLNVVLRSEFVDGTQSLFECGVNMAIAFLG